MSSSLALILNTSFPLKFHAFSPHKPHALSLPPSKSLLCFSSSSSSGASSNSSPNDRDEFLWLREEQRWLREEQRWLREEQRWLREEQRWLRERESLLAEIRSLKLQIQALEGRISVQGPEVEAEAVAKVGALLEALKEKNLIPEIGTSSRPMELEEKEVVRVSGKKEEKKKRRSLRKGSEGEEVREMQVGTAIAI